MKSTGGASILLLPGALKVSVQSLEPETTGLGQKLTLGYGGRYLKEQSSRMGHSPWCRNPTSEPSPYQLTLLTNPRQISWVGEDTGQQAALHPPVLCSVDVYGAPLCTRTVLGTGRDIAVNTTDGV